MNKYYFNKIIKAVLTIFFVYTLVFFLTRVTGDPVEFMLVDSASEAAKEQLKENLGLNLPLYQQYWQSFFGLFNGNAGTSYYYSRDVAELFYERLGSTLSLGFLTFLFTTVLGVLFGIIAAIKNNTMLDKFIIICSVIGNTIPNFILGILLIFTFSLSLRLLPSNGSGGLQHLVMPLLAMSVGPASIVARLTRGSMLDVMQSDYMESALAKGLSKSQMIWRHGLRNALIPIITILGSQLGYIIGGSVVVETVFGWPGIGTLIVNSAIQRDFPVVIFGVLLIAISVTVINLLVDLSYGYLDPRIRVGDYS
ncbi:peptide/nickel transport system permease protein [Ignavigranum ruoffiae]|uniref:Peptide/nickel transport system permease protein n=1 Tax=Ignavigranum ruoffiae TaxID=89093 RepID=A0A1H9B550_9LACT|nr:ABC transporter permease [Ignavigranum ruoffiae]SEP83969.1 peptide/nickel transport system permease protein [Ignavigranum ruoffiae]